MWSLVVAPTFLENDKVVNKLVNTLSYLADEDTDKFLKSW